MPNSKIQFQQTALKEKTFGDGTQNKASAAMKKNSHKRALVVSVAICLLYFCRVSHLSLVFVQKMFVVNHIYQQHRETEKDGCYHSTDIYNRVLFIYQIEEEVYTVECHVKTNIIYTMLETKTNTCKPTKSELI